MGGDKMGIVGKIGRSSIFVSFRYHMYRSSLSVLHMNSLTPLLPFFPDELFAADQFYSFEIRYIFFATLPWIRGSKERSSPKSRPQVPPSSFPAATLIQGIATCSFFVILKCQINFDVHPSIII